MLRSWLVVAVVILGTGCSLDDLTAGSPDACSETRADFCTEFDTPLPGPWDEVRGTPTAGDGELACSLPSGSPSCSYSDVLESLPAASAVRVTTRMRLGSLGSRVLRVSQNDCTHMLLVQDDGLRLHTQASADAIDQTGMVLETERWYQIGLDLAADGAATRVRVTVDGATPYEVTRAECSPGSETELSVGLYCDSGPSAVQFDWVRVSLDP